jgi:hypothetical protein
MLSVRQKKLSCLQLEHVHTARGLDELYVSHCISAGVFETEGGRSNVGGGGRRDRDDLVCPVLGRKERENAFWDCVGKQNL